MDKDIKLTILMQLKNADFYNVKHRVIDLSSIFIDGNSLLINLNLTVTEGDYKVQENINT